MNKSIRESTSRLKYILIYLALAASTLNLFLNSQFLRYSLLILTFFLAYHFKIKYNRKIFYFIVVYFFLIWINIYLFDKSIKQALIQFIYETSFYIFLPFLFIRIVNKDFPKYFINIIYFFSVISLVFWFFSNILPSFYNFTSKLPYILNSDPVDFNNPLAGRPEQFIFYTYETDRIGSIIRNPGSFHEPGAFAVFLIIAIILNYINTSKLFNKKGLVFTLAILTTFSTAGYMAFSIFLLGTLLLKKTIPMVGKIVSFFLISVIFTIAFFSFEFLSAKFEYQYNIQKTLDLNSPTTGRIFAARKAANILMKYPFTGKNLLVKDDYQNLNSEDVVVYGLMNSASKYGLPAIIMLLYLVYSSLRTICFQNKVNPKLALLSIFPLIIVFSAQSFFISPIVLMLIFYSSIYSSRYLHELRVNSIFQRNSIKLKKMI